MVRARSPSILVNSSQSTSLGDPVGAGISLINNIELNPMRNRHKWVSTHSDDRCDHECIRVISLRILAEIELGRYSRLGSDKGVDSEEASNRRIGDSLLKGRGGGKLGQGNVGDVGEGGSTVGAADVDDRSDSSY